MELFYGGLVDPENMEPDLTKFTRYSVRFVKKKIKWVDFVRQSPLFNTMTLQEKVALMATIGCYDLTHDEIVRQSVWNTDSSSSSLFRFLFWDESFDIREKICALIRYRDALLTIPSPADNINEYMYTLAYLSMEIPLRMLYLFSLSRAVYLRLKRSIIDSLYFLKKVAEQNNCFDKPFSFQDSNFKFEYFNMNEKHGNISSIRKSPKPQFSVTLMAGIAGSGKSSYIRENMPGIPVVSRDVIRQELGYAEGEDKVVGTPEQENEVTKVHDRLINEYCTERRSFVIDNMYIRHKYRKATYEAILPFVPYIVTVYSETSKEEIFKRREGIIPQEALTKMLNYVNIPSPVETHCLKFNLNCRKE
jgi:predicted kinase